jgi:hypothetical protein
MSNRIIGPRNHLVGHVLDLFLDLGEAAADEALGRIDRVLGIQHRLAARQLPHQSLARLGERHDGGREATPLGVGDDRRLAGLHHGDYRIGCSQINPD